MSKSRTKHIIPQDEPNTYNFIWRTKSSDWPLMTRQTLITTHNSKEFEIADLCLTAPALGKVFTLIPIVPCNILQEKKYNIEAETWSEAKMIAKKILKKHLTKEAELLATIGDSLLEEKSDK